MASCGIEDSYWKQADVLKWMNTAGGGQTRLTNGPSSIGPGPPTGPSSSGPTQQLPPAVITNVQHPINQPVTNGQQMGASSPSPYGDEMPGDKPEPDALKMFVGQVPKHFSEADLKSIFSEFGEIYQINVLRDKQTNMSKGCCFVTYYARDAALKAQNALHNQRTLPGMSHPLQMKPANKEKRGPIEERKLFVGMLSKKMTEDDVRVLFSRFGTVEECSVIRDENKMSKGYAFVTFSSKQGALSAVQQMNGSRVDGCPAALVVRIADSQRDKDYRRQMQQAQQAVTAAVAQQQQLNSVGLQQQQASIGSHVSQPHHAGLGSMTAGLMQGAPGNGGGTGGWPSMIAPSPVTSNTPAMASYLIGLLQQAAQSGNLGVLGNVSLQQFIAAISSVGPNNSGLIAQLLTSIANQQTVSGASSPQGPNDGFGASDTLQTLQNLNALQSLANSVNGTNGNAASGSRLGLGGSASHHPGTNGLNALAGIPGHDYGYASTPSQYGSAASMYGLAPNGGGHQGGMHTAQPHHQMQSSSLAGHHHPSSSSGDSPAGKKTSGPDGCNLFIYHLPPEYTDHDLALLFSNFGNLVSAKVFIDKQTNLSKCFGFVSFDNPQSASNAIVHMNGYSIGQKRLKVQQKRPKGPNDLSPGSMSGGGGSTGGGPVVGNNVTNNGTMSSGLMAAAAAAAKQQQAVAAMAAAAAAAAAAQQQQQY